MFEKDKGWISLDYFEKRILRHALNDFRNGALRNGDDALAEHTGNLILKIEAAPLRKKEAIKNEKEAEAER
jgi:hypothetical protein